MCLREGHSFNFCAWCWLLQQIWPFTHDIFRLLVQTAGEILQTSFAPYITGSCYVAFGCTENIPAQIETNTLLQSWEQNYWFLRSPPPEHQPCSLSNSCGPALPGSRFQVKIRVRALPDFHGLVISFWVHLSALPDSWFLLASASPELAHNSAALSWYSCAWLLLPSRSPWSCLKHFLISGVILLTTQHDEHGAFDSRVAPRC